MNSTKIITTFKIDSETISLEQFLPKRKNLPLKKGKFENHKRDKKLSLLNYLNNFLSLDQKKLTPISKTMQRVKLGKGLGGSHEKTIVYSYANCKFVCPRQVI